MSVNHPALGDLYDGSEMLLLRANCIWTECAEDDVPFANYSSFRLQKLEGIDGNFLYYV